MKRPKSAIDSTSKPSKAIWEAWTPTQQRAFKLLYEEYSKTWMYPPSVKFDKAARDVIAGNLAILGVGLMANYLNK